MLRYLFTAYYADGSAYSQNSGDTSLEHEGRSSFYDILNGVGCPSFDQIDRFVLYAPGIPSYTVELSTGHFRKDGELIPAAEESPVTPRRLVYYRSVRHYKVSPAIFTNPLSSVGGSNGELLVTDSAGTQHTFPKVATIAQEEDEEGNRIYKVWPMAQDTEVDFVIGWQANDAQGRNITQTITV